MKQVMSTYVGIVRREASSEELFTNHVKFSPRIPLVGIDASEPEKTIDSLVEPVIWTHSDSSRRPQFSTVILLQP